MTICIEKIDLCLEVPIPGAARESLSAKNRLAWADYLPNDPEALVAESKQKGLELHQQIQ